MSDVSALKIAFLRSNFVRDAVVNFYAVIIVLFADIFPAIN